MGASVSRRPSDAEERLLDPNRNEDYDEPPSGDVEDNIKNAGQENIKRYIPASKLDNGEDHKLTNAGTNDTSSDEKSHSSVGRIVSLARPEFCTLFVATLALIVSTGAQLLQPLFFGKIIEVCSSDNDEDSNHEKTNDLNKYAIMLVVILAIGALASMVRGWLYVLVGERLVRKLRADLFTKMVNLDITFFDSNKTGELMNRLASDTTVIQNCLSVNISMGLRASAEIIVSIILLFITCWQLTVVMMAVVPALMVIVICYGSFTKKLTKQYQDALAKAADSGAESIANARIVKSFAAEDWESRQYHENITLSYKKGAKKAAAYGVFAGGVGFLMSLAILVVIYYGATLVIQGKLTVGNLTAFILYTIYIAIDIGLLSGLYTDFMNAVGAGERIFKILDTDPAIPTSGGQWPSSCMGRVSFHSVTFAYPTRPDVKVLRDFDLTVEPNQTVALVGSSGSGKSTVLGLLERFYDVGGTGRVCIDGVNIKDIDPRWLHRNMVIVPQEPVLFSGTIFSNIAYSRTAAAADREDVDPLTCATMEEVIQAGKQANAHEFITSFPEGYDTVVGERGVRLSGGQKQRVAIARALLADPRILLLDEATSALDAESEMLVQDAINKLMVNRTVIIIAHRLSTVKDADVIAVFGKGKIVDAGRHEELLQTSATYANLVRKQLSGPTGRSLGGGAGGGEDGSESNTNSGANSLAPSAYSSQVALDTLMAEGETPEHEK
mmetsp:Transcript_33085/g.55678  ORF Transcript_33085/g.55678 Transcript_33085/m.55678 type:complete len:725 (-) Transcript_33085:252-2426(-)|eukprot:CAMPEP_0174957444 /NCGR_PEP_ID=MMETSP0004_2-20121128/2075_1 /TAXON_ID=420556 /ORGANISM="Ochromonas sp., Strain CCMP1393" /LENGTH=724 /DNA_ID=CAMNT_0016205553 /DNA_START=53 /DNA_END=2227 /DNA_ORIENTATION=+